MRLSSENRGSVIFSTTGQQQLDDSYFSESGDKIRFFMEADAFLEDGGLRQSKEHSLNKMGHAMHDLDPVFDAFSRTPELAAVAQSVGFERPAVLQSMYIFKPPNIGGEVVCHQDSTFGLHRRIDGLTRLRRPNRLSPSLPSSGCDKICLI